MTHLNHESVNTHQLNDGDVIEYYGCRFQLKNRKVWPMEPKDDPVKQAEVVTFDTDLLVYCGDVMPKHWADRWSVQGNKLAMWCRLVEPAQ